MAGVPGTFAIDCTKESGDRGEVFSAMQSFFESLRMTRRQFVVTHTRNADDSFSFVVEGNGRAVGDPEPESKPAKKSAAKAEAPE